MSLFKKSYLKELRSDLIREAGGDIPDEAWNKIIKDLENKIRKDLEKELPKAFWLPLLQMAEKGDVVLKIDDIDIGAKIRKWRKEIQTKRKG